MDLLFFTPIYKSRVWGGDALIKKFNREFPDLGKIGESWEIVDREQDQSVVKNGKYAGITISSLLKLKGLEILGPKYKKNSPFPILVKWLDCQSKLSVQVHPREIKELNPQGEPKTESWYIHSAKRGAKIYLGFNRETNEDEVFKAIKNNEIESLLNVIETNPGDSYLVKSGTIHAIGAGNFILEIQQNSDTTYRLYDWNRVGLDGAPRKLHLKDSLKSLTYNSLKNNRPEKTKHFNITEYALNKQSAPLLLKANQSPRILHVIEGELKDTISGETLSHGDNVLQPITNTCNLTSLGFSKLLITDNF